MLRRASLIALAVFISSVQGCCHSPHATNKTRPVAHSARATLAPETYKPVLGSKKLEDDEYVQEHTDIRCGTLTLNNEISGPRDWQWTHGDYRLSNPMIARPRGRVEDFAAGWNLCVLLPGLAESSQLKMQFEDVVLRPNVGRAMCFLGSHGGFGQYHVHRAVDPKFKYSFYGLP